MKKITVPKRNHEGKVKRNYRNTYSLRIFMFFTFYTSRYLVSRFLPAIKDGIPQEYSTVSLPLRMEPRASVFLDEMIF